MSGSMSVREGSPLPEAPQRLTVCNPKKTRRGKPLPAKQDEKASLSAMDREAFYTVQFRASLNIRRAEAREKIFRQMKQDSARVVDPTRRNVVKYDGKDSAEISCDEFLEMPIK